MQTLTGTWKLAADPDNIGREQRWFDRVQVEAQDAPVPGVIQQVFPGYHGVAWYWHTFELMRGVAASPDERVSLQFGAVDYLAEVWINGSYAGTCEGGETPFEFDITDALKKSGPNLLAVRVLNPTNDAIDGYVLKQTPHRCKVVPMKNGATFNSGGIVYAVQLCIVPAVHIEDVFVQPEAKSGQIAVTVTVYNSQDVSSAGQIAASVTPSTSGELLARAGQEVTLSAGRSEHELIVTILQPHLWNLDDPYLYRVAATVTTDAESTHEVSVRCGFRDFCVVDGYFHLNGKRILLKSTHTLNAMPIGLQVAVIPDHVRRDMINAKASGFNMVRFIAGVGYPEQLDFCDEIGLMVYEENFASWCLEDSPQREERFSRNTLEMVRRDRNHPSVTIWGLLNETRDGPVFRQAVSILPGLRQVDPTRLVLLGSGRWDGDPTVGSVSNPGSVEWEPVWGVEGPDARLTESTLDPLFGGYSDAAGDAHMYPPVPHGPQVIQGIRALGQEDKPVFFSEYGIGSLMDVIGEWRHFEAVAARPDLEDVVMVREQSEALVADWRRLGFDDVYPFPEDLLRESQRLHARQRTIGFDLIRSNPRICGYNLTGMLDHVMGGEGLWTLWRDWKPATFDAVTDGWSPLRWCLFADPLHGYAGRTITVEASLANEDVLKPGEYPLRFRIFGPNGAVWEKATVVRIPDSAPLAVPVLREAVTLDGPAGSYTLAANLERGGAASGGRLSFYLSEQAALPELDGRVTLWGIERRVADWLTAQGARCQVFGAGRSEQRELILVGKPADTQQLPTQWAELMRRLEGGAIVVFLSAQAFTRGDDSTYWLPLQNKGRWYSFHDWLYHKECVAKRHPVFEGLHGPGIMDWDYYGPVIPHDMFEGQNTPDETIAAAFVTGHPSCSDASGYGAGLLMAAYRYGQGRFFLSTPNILENVDVHPAADRLLLNLIRYAQQ